MASITIEQWITGSVDFNLTESCIKKILFDRAVAAGTPADALTMRVRKLCYADVLMYMVRSSVTTGGELISDGGWQHQKSAKNVFDRKRLEAEARAIYEEYEPDSVSTVGKIVMKNLY